MEILLIIVLLVLISCSGWILKGLSVIGKFSFGCFFQGLIYAFCAYIILMMLLMLF